LHKWHGNSDEVFADHAVTPGQQQLKTSPTASDLRQDIFRQHRPKADMEQLSASEFASI
jgi:hypothetical protein